LRLAIAMAMAMAANTAGKTRANMATALMN
jgi:hypothetical protein